MVYGVNVDLDDGDYAERKQRQLKRDLARGRVVFDLEKEKRCCGCCSSYTRYVRNNHPVLSIVCADRGHPFSRRERLIVLLAGLALAVWLTSISSFLNQPCPTCPDLTTCISCLSASSSGCGWCDVSGGKCLPLNGTDSSVAIRADNRSCTAVEASACPAPVFSDLVDIARDVVLARCSELKLANSVVNSEGSRTLNTETRSDLAGPLLTFLGWPIVMAMYNYFLTVMATCGCVQLKPPRERAKWERIGNCQIVFFAIFLGVVHLLLGALLLSYARTDFVQFGTNFTYSKVLAWVYWFPVSTLRYGWKRGNDVERLEKEDFRALVREEAKRASMEMAKMTENPLNGQE